MGKRDMFRGHYTIGKESEAREEKLKEIQENAALSDSPCYRQSVQPLNVGQRRNDGIYFKLMMVKCSLMTVKCYSMMVK